MNGSMAFPVPSSGLRTGTGDLTEMPNPAIRGLLMSKQRSRLYRFLIGEPPSQEVKDRVQRQREEAGKPEPTGERGTGRLIFQVLTAVIVGNLLAMQGLRVFRGYYPDNPYSDASFVIGIAVYGVLFGLFCLGIWFLLDRFFARL